MIRFEDILDKVESYKPDFDEELLDRAFVFSARVVKGRSISDNAARKRRNQPTTDNAPPRGAMLRSSPA